jgi:hypothetical protein
MTVLLTLFLLAMSGFHDVLIGSNAWLELIVCSIDLLAKQI